MKRDINSQRTSTQLCADAPLPRRSTGSNTPFLCTVRIVPRWRCIGEPVVAEDDFYPGGFQDLTEALAVLRIPVDDQVGLATSKAIHSVGQLPCHLRHPLTIG